MHFVFNDGGRKDAGYKGFTRDCVVRSIAIITGKPYQEVYDAINVLSESERFHNKKQKKSSARDGVHRRTYQKYLLSLGYKWYPTMHVGSGCKVHLKKDELPAGKLVVRLSRHLTAVIDGVVHDIGTCDRDGTRCVYGYFKKD